MTKLPMPSKQLIEEQIAKKIQEEQENAVVKNLDGDDTVRLENFILKQHTEQLTRQLEDGRRQEADRIITRVRQDLESYLVDKYGVNTETHRIKIDAKSYTLSIVPLSTSEE